MVGVGGQVWQGDEYSSQSAHHRSFDEWFLAIHPPRTADTVVDAGCGSGEFTARLADVASGGRVIGVDRDESMLAAARGRASANLEFRAGTIEHLDEVCDAEAADLVVSRAVFHWIELADWPRSYAAVRRVLKPGGWFHAESGGQGNVHRIVTLMDEVALDHGLPPAQVTSPHAAAAMELLEQAGFEPADQGVTTVAQRRAFDREELRGFVRTQASQAYVSGAPVEVREAFLAAVDERVDEVRRHDGTYDQTFVRLHVLARRPDRQP